MHYGTTVTRQRSFDGLGGDRAVEDLDHGAEFAVAVAFVAVGSPALPVGPEAGEFVRPELRVKRIVRRPRSALSRECR
jgi:hypothetical protein